MTLVFNIIGSSVCIGICMAAIDHQFADDFTNFAFNTLGAVGLIVIGKYS